MTTEQLLPMEMLARAATMFRLLGHPHRLRICELLMGGKVSVGDLADHLNVPPNAVSQHLNIMKAHGLLDCERDGKTVYYRVADPRPAWLLNCIREHCTAASPDRDGSRRSSAEPDLSRRSSAEPEARG